MSILPWIDDASLMRAIDNLLSRSEKAHDNSHKRILKNVIDPFSSLMAASTFDLESSNDLKNMQASNSANHGISSAIGYFHQDILSSISGFSNHDAGYDLENQNRKILAKTKNKHNTMSASDRGKTIGDLDTAIKQKQAGWEAYLVIIIPKKPKQYKTKLTKRQVFEVDGSTFYHLATKKESALHDLYYAVEQILKAKKATLTKGDILQYCSETLNRGIPK